MRIFKFGGTSVKDAASVENIVKVLEHEGIENTLVVISAMGKMTNAFEKIVNSYFFNEKDFHQHLSFVRHYHEDIIEGLFPSNKQPVLLEIEKLLEALKGFLISNKSKDYNFIYDQVVGYGELISTKIISSYLIRKGIKNNWIDVRKFIKTDANYRDANVNWEQTRSNITGLDTASLNITQGFISSSENGSSTTLGREGSDFTAAIFAYCLDAKSVTIWKDVDGVLNADPRHFDHAQLLHQISYDEAIEMAFYGASVIHPKTIKPLENKNIPLFVRSFNNLNSPGTTVGKGHHLIPEIPCFILKQKQILVSISALDFSFMVEYNLRDIFKILHDYRLKVNLIQNSALSFSVCIEDKFNNFQQFIADLKLKYTVGYFENVSLYTIRHADDSAVLKIEQRGDLLLKQATKGTVQVIMQ